MVAVYSDCDLLIGLGFFRRLFIIDDDFVAIDSECLVELFQATLDHAELCAEFTFVEILLLLVSFLDFFRLFIRFHLESPNANFGHLIHAILTSSLDLELHLVFL